MKNKLTYVSDHDLLLNCFYLCIKLSTINTVSLFFFLLNQWKNVMLYCVDRTYTHEGENISFCR